MRRKQDSRRRWIARFRIGRWIPYWAIVNRGLKGFGYPNEYSYLSDCYRRSPARAAT